MIKNNAFRTVYTKIALLGVILGSLFIAQPLFAATNLIANGDLQIATTPTAPDNFFVGGFNDVFTHLYPVAGPSDNTAAQITITNHTDGDAKWIFENVPATTGALYTFSDSYKSDIPSALVAVFAYSNNTNRFVDIATLPPTNGAWATSSAQFTALKDVVSGDPVSMTVYHVIRNVGTLTTDNYSLSLTATSADNIFNKGLVSITFDDGWASQYDAGFPILEANNLKATFYIIGTPTVDASVDLLTNPEQSVLTSTTPDGVTWSNIFIDPTNLVYRFSDTYTSTETSVVTVSFTPAVGSTTSITSSGFTPGTNAKGVFVFTLPPLASSTPITISHTSSTSSPVVATPTSLTEYGAGYMGSSQLLDLNLAGNEIGVHTQNHCVLTQLPDTTNCAYVPTTPTVDAEINTSANLFRSIMNPVPVTAFAYPSGAYNADIKTTVGNSGFSSARSIDLGYNTKNTDKLALKVQIVDSATTFDQVKSWIDLAAANKFWLILVFHQVDNPATIISNGEQGGVTPEFLSQIASYLHSNTDVDVKTVGEVSPLVSGPTLPPTNNIPVLDPISNEAVNFGAVVSFTAHATDADLSDTLTYSLTNAPAGASIDGVSGAFSWTTNAVGTFTFTVSVSDGNGGVASQDVTVTVNQVPSGGGGGGAPAPSSSSRSRSDVRNATSTLFAQNGLVLGASASQFIFTQTLTVGSTGNEVTELQKRLTLESVYTGPITGYFGNLTKAGVLAYQGKVGLEQVGIVGPKTREKLNSGSVTTLTPAPVTDNASAILKIQQMIKELQAQLMAALAKGN